MVSWLLASWFQSFLVAKFLGFLVLEFLGFKVSKIYKISIPCSLDIDFIFNIFKKCLEGSSGFDGAHLFQKIHTSDLLRFTEIQLF